MGNLSACCSVEESADKTVMKDNPTPHGGGRKDARKESGKRDKLSNSKDKKKEKEADKEAESQALPPPLLSSPSLPPSESKADVEEFQKTLIAGIPVVVLLQDGTKLVCTLQLNLSDNPKDLSLCIKCEDKVRAIPISDIKALLHSRDQLKRVETKANLVDDENCVALHLEESGNCIPLQFKTVNAKLSFVEMTKNLKEQAD